jgi:hypothetical protein
VATAPKKWRSAAERARKALETAKAKRELGLKGPALTAKKGGTGRAVQEIPLILMSRLRGVRQRRAPLAGLIHLCAARRASCCSAGASEQVNQLLGRRVLGRRTHRPWPPLQTSQMFMAPSLRHRSNFFMGLPKLANGAPWCASGR